MSGKEMRSELPTASDGTADEKPTGVLMENEDGAARDKGKAIKFKKMSSELPPHVLRPIDSESRSKSSPRAFQSYVINKLYCRNSNGTLSLALDRPLSTEHQRAAWLMSAQMFSVIIPWNNRLSCYLYTN